MIVADAGSCQSCTA